ncbi:hypothetical protein TgHK011_006785 [Trichoderma gracile]|nr:hypothetical protein TgHK011_006785 [Trichoderma gracile]
MSLCSKPSAWLRLRGAYLGFLYITIVTLSFFIGTSSAKEEGDRTGNWTSLTCSDPAVQDALWMGCAQRWSELDADDAWKDVIRAWTQRDEGRTTFSVSVMNTLHASNETDCGLLPPKANCYDTLPCGYFQGSNSTGGSGPAAYLIYESFVVINQMYNSFYNAIQNVARNDLPLSLPFMEQAVAPVLPEPAAEWLPILRNMLDLGVAAISASFFNGAFGSLPALGARIDADTAKDITDATLALTTASVSATVDGSSKKQWTPKSQTTFSSTVGQVFSGWVTVIENQLYTLFDGSESSVKLLGSMIANGHLLECNGTSPADGYDSTSQLESFIQKAFYAFAIPALWTVSGTNAFVVDSGYPCGTVNPLTRYMTEDTQEATYSCHNGSLYYLVYPGGDSHSHFTAPPGLDGLTKGLWGNLTLSDLIAGSVNTYVANGNANGGPSANPQDQQTLQDLANHDITTPGFITLPVCSPEVAWASWSNPSRSNSSAPGYPCNPLQGA